MAPEMAFWHSFWPIYRAILLIVGGATVVTVTACVRPAHLLDQAMDGRRVLRIPVMAPFLATPTASALVRKTMLMDMMNVVLAHLRKSLPATPVEW